jgi:imidazole glycerol phosphate synthase subunit HisF
VGAARAGLGAGEILINSIDRDGARMGYDLTWSAGSRMR